MNVEESIMEQLKTLDEVEVDETYEDKVKRIRPFKRKNPDNTESSHIMRHEQLSDGSWVVFPTLFPGYDTGHDTKEWHEFPDPPEDLEVEDFPAYIEAKKRDEVFSFESMKEAEEFALGKGWKDN